MNLNQKELKRHLEYNPNTGIFIRILANTNRIKVGSVAGTPHGEGYIMIGVNKNNYLAHRLSFLYMTGSFPEDHVDHINHIRTDNRWCNLRKVTPKENQKNLPLKRTNKSGVHGVRWVTESSRWNSVIRDTYLGSFVDKFEAICVRKSAEVKYNYHKNHGSFNY